MLKSVDGVARREAGAGGVAAEEDVAVVAPRPSAARPPRRCRARRRGWSSWRGTARRPADCRRSRARSSRGSSRQTELVAEQPVARRATRSSLGLGEIEPVGILELVGAPVEGPHLEAQIVVGLGALEQVLREMRKFAGAALEARDQDDESRAGCRARIVELKARVAGVVQVEDRTPNCVSSFCVADADARTARGVGRCRAARDVDRRDRRTVAERVARSGTSAARRRRRTARRDRHGRSRNRTTPQVRQRLPVPAPRPPPAPTRGPRPVPICSSCDSPSKRKLPIQE